MRPYHCEASHNSCWLNATCKEAECEHRLEKSDRIVQVRTCSVYDTLSVGPCHTPSSISSACRKELVHDHPAGFKPSSTGY